MYSTIEAGRIKLQPEDIELDDILAEAVRVVGKRAEDKNITVAPYVDAGLHFKADRRAVKQIALNLLSNAIKFTPHGGTVTVRGRARAGCVTFAIADTGIGIEREALNRLGRPFEQVESQHTKSHQGSGLGLAIAKSLAQLHGGSMRIRSSVGIGTLVVIRLPLESCPWPRQNVA
jgi:two-component system cell cycle sensor histidine kinase PleC